MDINNLLKYISCPVCQSNLLLVNKNNLSCIKHNHQFPIINGILILLKKSELDNQEISQKLWFDRHYSKFKNTYHSENWRLSMLNRIFNHSFTKSMKTYLDIGCGASGYTTIGAVKKNKVDHQTAFIVASAQNLPFKKNTFDYVLLVTVLEHLDKDYLVVNQIEKILKKNKYFFICVTNAYHKILSFIWPFYYYNDVKIGHKRHYSIKSLNRLLKKYILINHFYNGHSIKLIQLLLNKLKSINNNLWWKIENQYINHPQPSVQLNAIYQ